MHGNYICDASYSMSIRHGTTSSPSSSNLTFLWESAHRLL